MIQFSDSIIKQAEPQPGNLEPLLCQRLKWNYRMTCGEVVGVSLMHMFELDRILNVFRYTTNNRASQNHGE